MRLPKSLTRLVESTFDKFKANPNSYPNHQYVVNGVTFRQGLELKNRYFEGYSVKMIGMVNHSQEIIKNRYSVTVSKGDNN